MQTSARVRTHIFSLDEGKLFTTRELTSFGPRGTIDQALFKLAKRGVIVRIADGIYMRDTADRWRPPARDVAIAKAWSYGKELYEYPEDNETGSKNEGGSHSTTYLSNGCSSSFTYNNQRIYIKGVCPGKLKGLKPLTSDRIAFLPLPRRTMRDCRKSICLRCGLKEGEIMNFAPESESRETENTWDFAEAAASSSDSLPEEQKREFAGWLAARPRWLSSGLLTRFVRFASCAAATENGAGPAASVFPEVLAVAAGSP